MSNDTTKNTQSSLNLKEIQDQIELYREKRDELNKKTKDYINRLQDLESKINEYLRVAKEEHKKKRDYWNEKVKKLKDKKIEYKNLLDNLIEERKQLQKNSSDSSKFGDLRQINRKIDVLERKIETEHLDISEENSIIDTIRELAEEKQKILEAQNAEEILKLERKIEIVKINLNKIYEQLTKWSNKSQDNHAKMLEVYDKVTESKEQKKKMEEELIKNKQAADNYHEKFLELMNQRKKLSKGKLPSRNYGKSSRKPRKTRSKNQKEKEAEMLEKVKKEKLATALEKKKAGKKLNLYEARLILEAQNFDDN